MAGLEFKGGFAHGGREAAGYLMHDDPTPEARERTRDAQERSGKITHIDTTRSRLNYDLISPEGYKQAWSRYKERRDKASEIGRQCRYKKDVWNRKHTAIIHHAGDLQTYAATRYRTEPDGRKVLLYRKGDPVMSDARTTAKNRITMMTIVCYIPQGLTYEERKKWCGKVVDIFADRYGRDNLVQAAVHEDEIHDYYDSRHETMRTSRSHMHVSLVPTGEDGRLDGHACCGRETIMELNQRVEDMTVREFGCHFMTGEKYKEKRTVEELKAQSLIYEQEQRTAQAQIAKEQAKAREIQARELLADTLDQAAERLQQIDEEEMRHKARRDRAKAEADEAQQETADALLYEQEAKERQQQAQQRAEYAEQQAAEAEQRRIRQGRIMDVFDDVMDMLADDNKGLTKATEYIKEYIHKRYTSEEMSRSYRERVEKRVKEEAEGHTVGKRVQEERHLGE